MKRSLSSSLPRKRSWVRIIILVFFVAIVKTVFFSTSHEQEIKPHNVLERVAHGTDKTLDVQRHQFLQRRMGGALRKDIFDEIIYDGVTDYWTRFQSKFITSKETSHIDTQVLRSSIEDLLAMNGWVTAACSTLARPFGQNRKEEAWDELLQQNHLYYIAIIIHSADHFLVDQLAAIVQIARRLGPQSIFVSMLDYDSDDATPTLLDLCEAVLTLLAVPFRIRHVPRMTENPKASYYPKEEAYTRNLALEPLWELKERRSIVFHRVIWLKGFTCPTDILETIKVSQSNDAALVCGMDWAEFKGNFIFSDRWRARDMDGDAFRRAKSSAPPESGPPRHDISAARYGQHLPFQVFCCESGTHVVDPEQSYYKGLKYRHGTHFYNSTRDDLMIEWDRTQPCQDSTQAWFCRDLWVDAARDGAHDDRAGGRAGAVPWINVDEAEKADKPPKRVPKAPARASSDEKSAQEEKQEQQEQPKLRKRAPADDAGAPDEAAKAGSNADAMPEGASEEPMPDEEDEAPEIPNGSFKPARILVNPRCVTTYAGVSHSQLALDLFSDRDDDVTVQGGKYVLDDWEGAPSSFTCQEQRQTGGRTAVKTQRRQSFAIHKELRKSVP
ncbi:hypothetical protein M408DRAFT_327492 [Serendipita vermifera MAFF 305830]|uniref:Glycosyltransferase family 69 protein n=1 Tax=Serendipita vermifera MAFF 305830 TaxID=933852 RepID=A0A0C3B319_SERVB|nr:hypothetical protein M408DRAFT_327492 [Serendipita vermifera MAFF 305830]